VDVITEFFAAIPDVFVALWDFGRGWSGLAVTLGSIALVALFLLAAQRTRDDYGWVSATFGGCAATVAGLWAFGILPSAWIYFLDGQADLMSDTIIPSRIAIGDFVVFGNFYQVFRDSIVMVETMVAMAAFTALALWVQKKYPRALAEGEEPREQSGGYK
jgi:hypothetical protein